MAELSDDSALDKAKNEYWACKAWFSDDTQKSIHIMFMIGILYMTLVIMIERYRERKIRRPEKVSG